GTGKTRQTVSSAFGDDAAEIVSKLFSAEATVIAVKSPLKIAVAGLGTVGAGTLQLLDRQADLLAQRAGRRMAVVAVPARARRRRDTGDQDPARGSGRKPARAGLRHSQRDLQLYPNDDAPDRARILRSARRGSKARLCRSRSELRHRRHRRRAQARDPGERRV